MLGMLCDEWLVVLTSSSIWGLGWWECLSLYAMRFALSLSELICAFPSLFYLQRHCERGLVKVVVVEEVEALLRLGDTVW